MRKATVLISFFLLTAGLIGGMSRLANGVGQAVNIQTRAIEGFEKQDAWVVKYSQFRCRNWGQETKEKPDDSQEWLTWVTADQENAAQNILPDGLPQDIRGKEEKTVMGVKACFSTQGYNWIVLEPKEKLMSQGISKAIDLWVWGSGFNYDLYIIVKDWRGFYHSLFMGNLEYFGWRNLRVDIPPQISQFTNYVPRIRPLEIVRLKLVASPAEKPDGFYAYFDYMQVQTDIYRERYNGDGLNNKRW